LDGRLAARLALSVAALLAAAGCSQPTAEQPFTGACAPFAVVVWSPAAGAAGVPTDVTVALTFSVYPDPDTLGSNDLLLTSGVEYRIGTYAVDFITRSAFFRPRNRLAPDLTYQISLLPGLTSLQGCPARSEQRTFHTGDGPAPPPDAAPTPPPFSDVLSIFAAGCGGSTCHRQAPADGGGCLDAPAKGLSLCDAEAYDALVGVDAVERSLLKRVARYDPARSYLLRKLIPAAPGGGPLPTVFGQRDPPGPPLPESALRTISDWIAAGASR